MTTRTASLPEQFFNGQDRLKGPLPAELVAPGYVASIAGLPPMDAPGHGEFGRAFYAAFPDLVHRVDDVVVGEGRVVAQFTLCGTHRAPFLGVPASGASIEVGAIAVFTVVDGRVSRLEGVFDRLGLMQQIGALPG